MTPDQINAVSAIAIILKAMGGLPIWGIAFFILVGPWVGMIVITGSMSKRNDKQAREFQDHVAAIVNSQDKRFEEVVRMYENNVRLVTDYSSLAGDLTGIITLSTRTLEGLVSKIDNNQFCPVVRKETGR